MTSKYRRQKRPYLVHYSDGSMVAACSTSSLLVTPNRDRVTCVRCKKTPAWIDYGRPIAGGTLVLK